MSRWMRQQRKRARRARYKAAVSAASAAVAEAKRYVPVLARMVKLLREDDSLPFGIAMSRASAEVGILVPDHMQFPILRTVFKIVTGAPSTT